MVSTWSWVSRRKQREVISTCIRHIDKIIEVAKLTKELMEKYSQGSLDEVKSIYRDVFEKEKEADDIKRSIIAELSKGIFHPIDREDLIRLTLTVDDVAAYLKAACRRLLLLLPTNAPKDISDLLILMASKVYDATLLIKDAVIELAEDPHKALSIADGIERIEEEVDDIRMNALERVLKWCDKAKVSSCIVCKEIVDSLENASDKCEDVADVIRAISLISL